MWRRSAISPSRRAGVGVLALLIASGCGVRAPAALSPAAPAAASARQVIENLKAYERRVGFAPTGNFAASSAAPFPGRCYYTGRLELPASYRRLGVLPAVGGRCDLDESKYDVFAYDLEVAATGQSPITPALAGDALERLLMVVPHEDFHNQPEMKAASEETAEAAATLVGFVVAAGFAREQYGAESAVAQHLDAEARLFSEKAAIVNDYYDRLDDLYASYRAGATSREDALARKDDRFRELMQACMAIEPAPVSFNRCPAVANNAGLAFDRTYTREYPALVALGAQFGGSVEATVTGFRRLFAREPAARRDPREARTRSVRRSRSG
jgi:Putative aminopeptidase